MNIYLLKLANKLDSLSLEKEADLVTKLMKLSGQIPAGMHRSLLQTGVFGESEYDELDYDEEEKEEK